ncbi:hypothetical protein Htur_2348 [Haloterrigena turkmenica DSM 5511]|uniref:Uncharacterized protein n=1 Tax=Haloterrigena turkmenica (strain ATCC 51198 / DSM 5511 / JCM 9101 / NCIMB 13204 / VKM B-1734 / 4k) TaxID=543526 RepID=D2RUQ4_HALTV|nr:hypothetical protein [Haloterrigena turkmenica]ADB61226.1 hypothetical protein Htur_2348 [Haloterrigena turkmenica DSM 5511]
MADLLYSIYAVAVLLVAVGGLLGVVFATPDVTDDGGYRYEALAVVAAVFVLAMVGGFLL